MMFASSDSQRSKQAVKLGNMSVDWPAKSWQRFISSLIFTSEKQVFEQNVWDGISVYPGGWRLICDVVLPIAFTWSLGKCHTLISEPTQGI